MTSLLRRYWPYLRPQAGLLLPALLCMVLTAMATGVYAYLIGPVVKFLFAGGLAPEDSLTRALSWLGAAPVMHDRIYALRVLPLLILVAALAKGLGQFGKFYLMGKLGELSVFRLRADLLKHLHELPLTRLHRLRTGDVMTRLTSDVTLVQEATTNVLGSLISDSLTISVLLGLALWLDWRLALITLVVLPALALPITWISRRLRATTRGVQQGRGELADHVQQDMHALGLIKSYGLSGQRREEFQRSSGRYLAASLNSYAARALASPIMEWVGALGLSATLWLAALRMEAGTLVPEHFISFFAAMLLLYEPMKNLGRLNTHLQSGLAGAERVFEVLGWEPESDEGSRTRTEFTESLDLSGVRCVLGGRPVLEDVTVSVRRGEWLAIVGESGAGKTSLARLLTRQLVPDAGEIALDGIPFESLTRESLRRLIVLVEQNPILFDDTIRANILMARPGASPAELEEAISRARLAELVAGLPDGDATRVGPAGLRLSEGEKQRIALARAFLRDAPIVILDEVTASLDPENSAAIQEAIRQLARRATVLMITHRLEQIPAEARVLRIEGGRIRAENVAR